MDRIFCFKQVNMHTAVKYFLTKFGYLKKTRTICFYFLKKSTRRFNSFASFLIPHVKKSLNTHGIIDVLTTVPWKNQQKLHFHLKCNSNNNNNKSNNKRFATFPNRLQRQRTLNRKSYMLQNKWMGIDHVHRKKIVVDIYFWLKNIKIE